MIASIYQKWRVLFSCQTELVEWHYSGVFNPDFHAGPVVPRLAAGRKIAQPDSLAVFILKRDGAQMRKTRILAGNCRHPGAVRSGQTDRFSGMRIEPPVPAEDQRTLNERHVVFCLRIVRIVRGIEEADGRIQPYLYGIARTPGPFDVQP